MGFMRRKATLARSHMSVRAYVSAIVGAILVPALFIAGWIATLSADSERVQLEQSAKNQAREVTAAIDREIVGIQNMLIVLASSPYLRDADFQAFHGQAVGVSRQLNAQIVVRDLNLDRQVVNTDFPWGTPLTGGIPALRSEAEEELLRSGKPVVSSVFFGPLIKRHVVAISVPVLRNALPTLFFPSGSRLKNLPRFSPT
jgi:hypothetical protein